MAKKNFERVISLMVALILFIGAFPVNSFAREDDRNNQGRGIYDWWFGRDDDDDDFGGSTGYGSKTLYWCYDSDNTNGRYSSDVGLATVTFNGSNWDFGAGQTLGRNDNATIVVTPAEGYRVTRIDMLCVLSSYSRDPYDCRTYNEGASYSVSAAAGSTSVTASNFTVSSACNHASNAPTYYVMVTVEKITAVEPEIPGGNEPEEPENPKPVYFELTYSAGEGTGDDHTVGQLEFASLHEVLAIDAEALGFTAPANHEFVNWLVTECTDKVELYDITGNEYDPGDQLSMPAGNVTLTAQWEEKEVPVPNKYNLTVNYVDETGAALAPADVTTGIVEGTQYATSAKAIENYELVDVEGIESGVITSDVTVTYTYKRILNKYNLTVNYVDETGAALAPADVTTDIVEGTQYATSAKAIENYELVDVEGTESGVITSDVTVTYTYKQTKNNTADKYTLIINYVDESGRTLAEPDFITDLEVGAEYITVAKQISGYEHIKTEGVASGIIRSNVTVNYIYKNTSVTYTLTVNYLSTNGTMIVPSEVTRNIEEGTRYETSAKSFANYELISTQGMETGIIHSNVIVTYLYKKVASTYTLTVNYVDTDGNALASSNVTTGIAEGSTYSASAKSIDGYDYQSSSGDYESGIMDSDKEVTFIYSKTEIIPENPVPQDPTPVDPTPVDPTPVDPTDEPIDIPDEEVPLTEIPDEDVPLTGDASYVWTVMVLVSAISLFVLCLGKKERA